MSTSLTTGGSCANSGTKLWSQRAIWRAWMNILTFTSTGRQWLKLSADQMGLINTHSDIKISPFWYCTKLDSSMSTRWYNVLIMSCHQWYIIISRDPSIVNFVQLMNPHLTWMFFYYTYCWNLLKQQKLGFEPCNIITHSNITFFEKYRSCKDVNIWLSNGGWHS